MADKLINPITQQEERLEEFLSKISELTDPKERHYVFLSYDHLEEEEQLYEFWRKTVHSLYEKVFNRTYATPKEIVDCFKIEGKKPYGLYNIIEEMRLRKDFIEKEELVTQNYYEETGWLASKFSQVLSWVSTSKQAEPDRSTPLVSMTLLENSCKSLVNWAFKQENKLFSMEQIEKLLKKSGHWKDDIKIILNHMKRTERMKVDGWVKIGDKGDVLDITHVEKTTYKLAHASEELEEKLATIGEKVAEMHNAAKVALRNKDREKASSFLKEKRTLETTENIIKGQKLKIDKQLIDIQMSTTTKSTLDALKLSSQQQQIIDEDLEDASEIMNNISDQNYNLQKINEMFTTDVDEDIDEEDLLKELMEEQDHNDIYDHDETDQTYADEREKERIRNNIRVKDKYQFEEDKEEEKYVYA